MKKTVVFICLLASMSCFAQKNRIYKASNNVTYFVGDSVKMGRGSAPNGDYRYLQMGGWAAALSYDPQQGSSQFNIGRDFYGMSVKIKKIDVIINRGTPKIYFVVGGGNITNYNLFIEDAIAACEVIPCGDNSTVVSSVADELFKLKQLLDSGAITLDEYNKEKKKLLDH
ncbi:MAG: SHOCT domain-containing protein [Mucilaginibacter sp.]